MQSCLAGFALTDCYRLLNADRLHGGPKGLIERDVLMKNGLAADEELLRTVNAALLDTPSFPGMEIPKAGLLWPRIIATEMSALSKALLVSLLKAVGFHDPDRPIQLLAGKCV